MLSELKLSFIVFIVLIICTFFTWRQVNLNITNQEQHTFIQNTYDIEQNIQTYLNSYINILLGIQGLFAANSNLTSEQFAQYIDKIHINEIYPGITAISYIEKVTHANKAEFIKQSQSDIQPPGDRPFYFAIKYVASFNPATTSFGYDVYTEENRRQAIQQAIDSGYPTMTNALQLVGVSESVNGFIIFAPIYQNNTDLSTVQSRRKAIQGLVTAVFQSDILFNQITLENHATQVVDFTISENNTISGDITPIFNSTDTHSNDFQATRSTNIEVAKHRWNINFMPKPNVSSLLTKNLVSIAVILGGTILSIFVLFVLYNFALSKYRLKNIADLMSAKFKESEEKFLFYFTNAPTPMSIIDSDYKFVQVNKAYCDMLGFTKSELLSKTIIDITHPDDINRDLEMTEKLLNNHLAAYSLEKRYIAKNGDTILGHLTASALRNESNHAEFGFGIFQPIKNTAEGTH